MPLIVGPSETVGDGIELPNLNYRPGPESTYHLQPVRYNTTSQPVLPTTASTVPTDLNYRPGPESTYHLQPVRVTTSTSQPVSPITASTVSIPPPHVDDDEKRKRRAEYTAIATFMWLMFMEGWHDGSSGPLLPAMQRYYHVGFTLVSLVFVTNGIGFVSAGIANITMSQKVGFGKTLVVGASMQMIAYMVQLFAPPFPVFVLAYVCSGFGVSLQLAHVMDFAISLNKNASTKMGIFHASYGVGALSAPLIATQFAAMSRRWSLHFLTSLGGSMTNVILLFIVFRFRHLNDVLEEAGQTIRQPSAIQGNHYSQLLKLKVVHLFGFFILAYVGVEFTLGGWISTFVINERGGGPSSGYLTTGFFAGMTLGRVCLLWLNRLVGERRVIWLYILLSIGLEITIWFIPSLVANGIAVAFIGMFLGPIYPIVMSRTGRLVPQWLMSGAVGWIAGLGQAGVAVVPFTAGAMASKFGVMSLQPVIVSVLAVMLGLWAVVPPDQQRSD